MADSLRDNRMSWLASRSFSEGWWRGLDSNQRTLARADLQSAAFNHSATSPRCRQARHVASRLVCVNARKCAVATLAGGASVRSMLDHPPDGLRVERVKGIEPSS